MLNIRSKKISKIKESIENGIFSKNEWEIFSDFNEEDLVELLEKTNEGLIPDYYTKIYFTVYSEEVFKNVELRLKETLNVNRFISKIWENTSIDATPEELSEAMMGCVVFNTDFITRLRNGFSLNINSLKILDKQIENFIFYLSEKIDLNMFYNEFFQPEDKIEDKIIINQNDSLSEYLIKNIKLIKTSAIFLELYSLLNEDNNYNIEEINQLEKYLEKELLKYGEDFNRSDYSFLNENVLLFIKNYINKDSYHINENIKYKLNNDISEFSLSVAKNEEFQENNNTESKVIDSLSNFLNSKNKKDNSSSKINVNEFLLNKKPKKISISKIILSIFILTIIVSWGAIIQSKHSENNNEETNLIEKKLNSANFKDEKFEINRSGIKNNE